MSLISVITINYNNRDGLQRTLESVTGQAFKDFEYIVIDGASTDGSSELLEKYHDRISKVISEPDKGVYDAMNKGITAANGEYLQFLNSGDVFFSPDTLTNVSRHLGSADICYGNMKILDSTGKLNDGFMPDVIDLPQMMRDTLWHPVSFIKKEIFDRIGTFDTYFRICGDYDFFFRAIIAKGCSTRHFNEFVVIFELNGMSSSPSNIQLVAAERKKAQSKYLSAEKLEQLGEKKEGFFRGILNKWFR
jgi:glycosyltransferase involved in cell wall biosynthesis